jgi:hypothetical protein
MSYNYIIIMSNRTATNGDSLSEESSRKERKIKIQSSSSSHNFLEFQSSKEKSNRQRRKIENKTEEYYSGRKL